MSPQLRHLLSLLSMLQLMCTVSAPQCSGNKRMYVLYAFQPNCSQSQTLHTRDTLTCTLAAAMSQIASAVVTPLAGGPCRVGPALCPRYQLASDSTVLMPVGLTALEHLLISVKSGCGHKVWDVVTQSAANSDYAVQPAHPDAAILPDTFRSSLLDNMQRLIAGLTYKHLIVQLYRNSSVVVRLVFDVGVASDNLTSLNWFRQNRLIESWPVTNLSSMSTNYFSIEGHLEGVLARRFFINYNYNGCENDSGFLIVVDANSEVCPMFGSSSPIPRIFYNPSADLTWVNGIKPADYIVVLAR